MKPIAPVLALLLLAGCASMPANSSGDSGGSGAAPGFRNDLKYAPEYILLSSPDSIRSWDFTALAPRGFYVRGTLTNHGFQAAGEIQGNGKFCAGGKDRLSLSDLKVYTAADAKSPAAPYIVGCATNNGFQPASRAIVTQ